MSSVIEISALCFGPGLLPTGQRVTARITATALLLDLGAGREESVPWFLFKTASGGFDHQQMLLSWSRGDEPWSLMPADTTARELLLTHAPSEMQTRLALWNKQVARTRRGFQRLWLVLGLGIVSPVLLLVLFWWQSERIVGAVVDRVSQQTEQDLGKLVFAQVAANTPLIKDGAALRAIQNIGAKLTAGSSYTYHWNIAKNPVINAFAMPGGYVVVNTGLILAADTAEEVAGVLAHEVQHVEKRHSLKGLVHNLGLSALVNLGLGDLGSNVWGNVASQLGTLKFGRDHETEADVLGLVALQKARIDANGMLHFFEKLKTHKGATLSLLSTHPASEDRLAALQTAIAKQQASDVQPLELDWAAIQADVKAR